MRRTELAKMKYRLCEKDNCFNKSKINVIEDNQTKYLCETHASGLEIAKDD